MQGKFLDQALLVAAGTLIIAAGAAIFFNPVMDALEHEKAGRQDSFDGWCAKTPACAAWREQRHV